MNEQGTYDALHRILRREWGTATEVHDLVALTGGASRETWRFRAVGADHGDRPLILRLARGAGYGAVPLAVEAVAMRAAAEAGVPVPTVHLTGSDSELDAEFMVMDHVDGETLPTRILRSDAYAAARPRLAAQLGSALATLHRTPLGPGTASLAHASGDPLGELRDQSVHDVPPPGLALAFRWLRDHPVPPGPTGLVHGDFRLGNLLVGPDGLAAVLDWEVAQVGDPLMDLGWLCAKVWRFGSALPVAGVGTREELLAAYESVAGWRPTFEQLHWWELYSTLRWGVGCGVQAKRHLDGNTPSVELAAIGRRTCEQELDVLLALGLTEPVNVDDPLADDGLVRPADLGLPSAADLAGALEHYLVTGPMALEGRLGFHARVAANVARTLRRELLLGPAFESGHRERLGRLGLRDDTGLGAAILDGSLDDRWGEVVETVTKSVHHQVLVANPRHLGRPA